MISCSATILGEGRNVIGHVNCIGNDNFTATDIDGRSLGSYPTLDEAAAAVQRGASLTMLDFLPAAAEAAKVNA